MIGSAGDLVTAFSKQNRALGLGLVLAGIAGIATWAGGLGDAAAWTAAVTTLCATWWVLEPISIPATSIIPFAVFPVVGVLSHKDVAAAYGHTLILLLLGGFMLSKAVESSGAHRRIALGMVRAAGGGGRRLVLGFMIASAVCSMWISNTATTLMLLPVALAVLEQSDDKHLAIPLLLGIAYAASIGGVATPVGTPPNVVFMSIYEQTTGSEYAFAEWMKIGVPTALIMVPIAWLWLTRAMPDQSAAPELPALGPWSKAEARVMIVFGITALLWVFRASPGGGWSKLIGVYGVAGDSTVAMAACAVLFVMPNGDGKRMLDWEQASAIPWGLLLLFGGGIAIASAFEVSGLSAALGDALAGLASWPVVAVAGIIALTVTFLTEVTSNTATTNLLMPILAAAGTAAAVDPRVLMIPAAMSASCAFMLPVATAPNAIMFGTGQITTKRMIREGFGLNLAGAVAITVVCSLILRP